MTAEVFLDANVLLYACSNAPEDSQKQRLAQQLMLAAPFALSAQVLQEFIANALKQHHLGLEETDDGIWSIYFGTVLLAKVDERDMVIRD